MYLRTGWPVLLVSLMIKQLLEVVGYFTYLVVFAQVLEKLPSHIVWHINVDIATELVIFVLVLFLILLRVVDLLSDGAVSIK